MKIERAKTAFAPITMVIETDGELDGLLYALRFLANRGGQVDNDDMKRATTAGRIYDKLVEASAEW
jgi:hypothetical protein